MCLFLFPKQFLKRGTRSYTNASTLGGFHGRLHTSRAWLRERHVRGSRGFSELLTPSLGAPRHVPIWLPDRKVEAEQRTNTWENTMTLPVSSFTVWMVPWTTAVPTTFPVTCPRLFTTATVWLLTEKWMIDCGWGPPSDMT